MNGKVNKMKLEIGVQVDIQRSDGRIHSASVSGVDIDAQNVTVEWFEYGETKGKEVNLDQIYALNPQYQDAQPIQAKLSQRNRVVNKRQSLPQHAAINDNEPTPFTTPAIKPARNIRSKSMAPPPAAMAPPAPKISQNGFSQQQAINEETEDINIASSERENQKSLMNAAKNRRSNCVKEVERLKKNREDRRARQSEVRNEQEKVKMELDPGNPNWLFLKMIREYQATLGELSQISMSDNIVDHQICVCVRKRPLNKKEIARKEIDIVTCPNKETTVVHECKLKVDLTKYLDNHSFRFDYAFDESATNELVYRYTAKPLVDAIFQQGMATCFAYGQTGSGKTHTMGGDFTQGKHQDCSTGIYALAAADIFKLQKSKYKNLDVAVSASFFEIYSGKVFDLLNKRKKLRVLEDGKAQVQVVNLQEIVVNNVQEVLKLLEQGMKTRTSGTTSANQNSSRSHAIFQIILRKRGHGKDGALFGKFSLIDLAGNERGADTISSDRQTRLEGAEINKSLLALKECIRALGRKGAHLPFRASKLTQVLRDSFIGENAKTCMIAMISPGLSCTEHTLNTLRYADRAKELGPDDQNYKKKVVDLDYESEEESQLSNSQSKYRNSELAMLCTKSDSAENGGDYLYNFHEAVSLLMETEEQMIDEHRTSMEENYNLLEEEKKLLERIENDVDCDLEEYVHRLDMILTEKIEKFSALRVKVSQFKEQLFEEEKASKNVRRLPFV
ncbi:kinesin-like protein KIF2A isoform X1 [Hydra vulgaris]|uniref:Kinesin-like protein n=1 Tax=Hydra vulgaris TaxID=6087 RepID=T2MJC3_HYDVU|nr:kinesin-like protein KIF2A [Hydra vulgaris]